MGKPSNGEMRKADTFSYNSYGEIDTDFAVGEGVMTIADDMISGIKTTKFKSPSDFAPMQTLIGQWLEIGEELRQKDYRRLITPAWNRTRNHPELGDLRPEEKAAPFLIEKLRRLKIACLTGDGVRRAIAFQEAQGAMLEMVYRYRITLTPKLRSAFDRSVPMVRSKREKALSAKAANKVH